MFGGCHPLQVIASTESQLAFLHDHKRRIPPQLHGARNDDKQKTFGSCGFFCLRSRLSDTIDDIVGYGKSQGGSQESLSHSSPPSMAGFPER